jgi:glucose/arabinose dehydrogenase
VRAGAPGASAILAAVRVRLLLLPLLALAACGDDPEPAPAESARSETAQVREERVTDTAPAEAAQAGRLRLRPIGRFASPLAVTAPPGDNRRVFVVEQGGRIRVIRGGRVLRRPFLDVSRRIVSDGEQGLLGLAFAPDYARSRRFYVNFTNRSGDTRIVEYRRSGRSADVADPRSARVLIRQDQPESNHNGGQLAFGPDGFLYIGLGDGGGGNDQHGERGNAQNLGTLLGKILRIDPRRAGGRAYRIPRDNPFRGRRGARPEIYSWGLRNPWRFSFDRETGDLIIGDVGQNEIEEIDFVARGQGRGANFGWRPYEGTNRIFDDEDVRNHVEPVIQKRHDDGYCSVTGGYVVRDPRLPALEGRYVYGDFCDGTIRSARLSPSGATDDRDHNLPKVGSLSSFGEDAQARVYVTSLAGRVYRLEQG